MVYAPVRRWLLILLLAVVGMSGAALGQEMVTVTVPILVYHRFAATVNDSMTVRTSTFDDQLAWLQANGYRVIPLRRVVDWKLGKAPAPPTKSVVIVADDGHRSVYTELLPRIRQHRLPVTLFIYPSAISNASYAMTWAQLQELQATGLVDIQSHSYWHPNFRSEAKRLGPDEWRRFVLDQLGRSRAVLQQRLGRPVDLLAWPFGVHDAALEALAAEAGFVAAFGLEGRMVTAADARFALPRILMTDGYRGPQLARLLGAPARPPATGPESYHAR